MHVVTSPDGNLAALLHRERVVVVSVPGLEPVAEIGLDTDAAAHDVVFAGEPLRLIVHAVHASDARMNVIDVVGPRLVGELRFHAPVRVAAVSGDHVLVLGGATTSVVDVHRRELAATALPSREVPSAAGGFGDHRFVACVGGLLEDWEARTGAPLRRVRLGRPVVARHVGGGEHLLWLVARDDLSHIDVVPLTAGKHARRIELPEPVERVAVHASGEILAILSATGAAWVVDLAAGTPLEPVGPSRIDDLAWSGSALLIAADGRDPILTPVASLGGTPSPSPSPSPSPPATTSQRLAAWRERVHAPNAPAGPTTRAAAPPPRDEPRRPGWRAGLATWARGVIAGAHGPPPADLGLISGLATRLDLDVDQTRAVALLYGARLGGIDGVAPVDLASALGWRWDEALGAGQLAVLGALRWVRSQVRLAAPLTAALDQRPPLHGTLIGDGPTSSARAAVIAPADAAVEAVAGWAAPQVGTVLVSDRSPPHPSFLLEARVRGAAPLYWAGWLDDGDPLPARVLVIVEDDDAAARLGLSVLGRWDDRAPT